MDTSSKPSARLRAAVAVPALALVTAAATAVALALPASARPLTALRAAPERAAASVLTVRQIAFGKKLHHTFKPDGTGKARTETLSSPDDVADFGGDIYVTFQNGVGPQGQASPDGDLDSTIVEFSLSGREIRQWDLRGKCDGLSADTLNGTVIATINEDANSSLYTISPRTGVATHYTYSEPLPHKGGTDAIIIYKGKILISASAPGTTGKAAPQASYPAVYVVTLNAKTRTAKVSALYYDEAWALQANGPSAGKTIRLALTDPDSNEVVPAVAAARYGGDFMLDSQGDQELIFDRFAGYRQYLTALHLPHSVDDSAWATTRIGALYTTDNQDDTLDMVTGVFAKGTMYSAVTPCDQNEAPATCPAPGFPENYLAVTNIKTGTLTALTLKGPALHPQGMIFVP